MKAADRPIARELLQLMLKRNKDITSRSIYERIEPDERGAIHSALNPGGTETGRFSHSETFVEKSTNLGNLPKKAAGYDELYEVRSCIVAPPGRMFGEADLSQAEARVAAWMCEDELAISQYTEGVDRYRYFAAGIEFDDPSRWREIDKKSAMRQVVGKMGLLAFQYGVGWFTFQRQVNDDADLTGVAIDAKLAKRAEGVFHELYPSYRRWHNAVLEEVLTKGFLRNPLGRRRDFFARADGEKELAALRREAVAFLPQSTVCDLLSHGIVDLYTNHDPSLLWLHLQIHDAIIFSCAYRDWQRAARAVKSALEREIMINGRPLTIEAEVMLSTTSWDCAEDAFAPVKPKAA